MIQSARPIAFKLAPGAANAIGPAPVLGKSVVGRSARNTNAGAVAIHDSLSKTPKTPRAGHPKGETAKIRTGLPAVSCWHCLQGSNYFQYGAQKYQMWRFTLEAPLGATGISLAENETATQVK